MYKCNPDGTITVKEHCMTSSCNHCATDLTITESTQCYMVGNSPHTVTCHTPADGTKIYNGDGSIYAPTTRHHDEVAYVTVYGEQFATSRHHGEDEKACPDNWNELPSKIYAEHSGECEESDHNHGDHDHGRQ